MKSAICVGVFFCLKAVRSFESDIPSSYTDEIVVTDGSVGNSIPVDSIRICVRLLIVRKIIQT